MVGFKEFKNGRAKLATAYDEDDLIWLSKVAAERNIPVAEVVRRCVKFARKKFGSPNVKV